MSDSSQNSTRVYPQPHEAIGAQDLLKVGRSYCGFMRKKGQLERIRDGLKFFGSMFGFKWRQRFIILSGGCLYIFTDEFAKEPAQSTSLNGYSQLRRMLMLSSSKKMKWCFQLIPEEPLTMKTFSFSCSNEEDRREWMKRMKAEMVTANHITENVPTEEDQEDYIYLEKQIDNVTCPTKYKKKEKIRKLPATPPEYLNETNSRQINSDEEQDDYDEIKDLDITVNPKNPLAKPRKAIQATKVKMKRSISRDEYEFMGSDRNQVERILNDRSKGTFLVRNSRADKMQVLSVNTDEGMKEYKIFENENEKVSIDKVTYFTATENLVDHYMKMSLPKRNMTLGRAYSVPDVRM